MHTIRNLFPRLFLSRLGAGALGLIAVLPAGAAEKYVTPTGGGLFDGSNWANAFSNIQQAVNASPNAGDVIYVQYGVYTNTVQIDVIDHPGLTIQGGYEGVGMDTGGVSILSRDPAISNRIFYAEGSTVTVERLTFCDGTALRGMGLFLTNCNATLANCAIVSNRFTSGSQYGMGAGLYAEDGTLTVRDTLIHGNGQFSGGSLHGSGMAAVRVAVSLVNVHFNTNAVFNTLQNDGYGLGLYLVGGSASIDNCRFTTNGPINAGRAKYGGAVYADGVNPLTVTNCRFYGNYSSVSGGALYLKGGGPVAIADCVFVDNRTDRSVGAAGNGSAVTLNNVGGHVRIMNCAIRSASESDTAAEALYVHTTNLVLIAHTTVAGISSGNGIGKYGAGSLVLTNCLIRSNPGHGLQAVEGTVTVANCTLADNAGWALTNAAASTLNVKDSILWDNREGGLVNAGQATVTYTCSQETHAGIGNRSENPLFVAGYYLSVNSLPYQSASSPCIDAGSATAAALGLDTRTTRTDGTADTAGLVDLGYHEADAETNVSNLFLYVDAVTGSDANDGLNSGHPLKTLTRALALAIHGSAIAIATGQYSAASGEAFPLVAQDWNLSLRGADRGTTVVDAGGAGSVLSSVGQRLWLEGLTFTNGNASRGGGLFLSDSPCVLTNCTVADNRAVDKGGASMPGAGV